MANQLAAKCSHWNGGSYCDDPNSPHADEVSEERYCAEHAGPLAWSAATVDRYSIALRLGAYYGFEVKIPAFLSLAESSET